MKIWTPPRTFWTPPRREYRRPRRPWSVPRAAFWKCRRHGRIPLLSMAGERIVTDAGVMITAQGIKLANEAGECPDCGCSAEGSPCVYEYEIEWNCGLGDWISNGLVDIHCGVPSGVTLNEWVTPSGFPCLRRIHVAGEIICTADAAICVERVDPDRPVLTSLEIENCCASVPNLYVKAEPCASTAPPVDLWFQVATLNEAGTLVEEIFADGVIVSVPMYFMFQCKYYKVLATSPTSNIPGPIATSYSRQDNCFDNFTPIFDVVITGTTARPCVPNFGYATSNIDGVWMFIRANTEFLVHPGTALKYGSLGQVPGAPEGYQGYCSAPYTDQYFGPDSIVLSGTNWGTGDVNPQILAIEYSIKIAPNTGMIAFSGSAAGTSPCCDYKRHWTIDNIYTDPNDLNIISTHTGGTATVSMRCHGTEE